ncbi:MAG TPA: deoxyribose-phosphate aldolase [Armatimonadota bacterium]|jgi:deoxyribose-phosphate aldolase
MDRVELLRHLDHAVLAPTVTEAEVLAGCEVALSHRVAAYVVPPVWLPTIVSRLGGSGVAAATTCGFPLGVSATATKTVEAYDAVMAGADEVDMVMNYSALRSGYYDLVEQDMRAVVAACGHAAQRRGRPPVVVKVILETCYLDDGQKARAVALAVAAGVSFVKTSTGVGPAGATGEDVALLRRLAPPSVGVKAAGGIRTVADCRRFLEAGATRLGTSATEQIARELSG